MTTITTPGDIKDASILELYEYVKGKYDLVLPDLDEAMGNGGTDFLFRLLEVTEKHGKFEAPGPSEILYGRLRAWLTTNTLKVLEAESREERV